MFKECQNTGGKKTCNRRHQTHIGNAMLRNLRVGDWVERELLKAKKTNTLWEGAEEEDKLLFCAKEKHPNLKITGNHSSALRYCQVKM